MTGKFVGLGWLEGLSVKSHVRLHSGTEALVRGAWLGGDGPSMVPFDGCHLRWRRLM